MQLQHETLTYFELTQLICLKLIKVLLQPSRGLRGCSFPLPPALTSDFYCTLTKWWAICCQCFFQVFSTSPFWKLSAGISYRWQQPGMLLPKTQAARNIHFSDTLIIQDESQAAHYNMVIRTCSVLGFLLLWPKKTPNKQKNSHKTEKPTKQKTQTRLLDVLKKKCSLFLCV